MQKKSKKILLLIVLTTGIISLTGSIYFFSSSIYINSKAKIAQILLNKAWDQTLINNKEIRPWSSADFYPFAQLYIPSGKTFIVLNTITGQALSFGPSFDSKSSYPGEKGRTVIGMHNSHSHFLKDFKKGDIIKIKTKEGFKYIYEVNSLKIIDSSKNKLKLNSSKNEIILYTCYPFNSINTGGSMRFVVQAILAIS